MLRVSFSSAATARVAVKVLEGYGYSATPFGRDVVTDCPTLLAVPAIEKRIGFAEIERLDLGGGADAIESTVEFCAKPAAACAERTSQATA